MNPLALWFPGVKALNIMCPVLPERTQDLRLCLSQLPLGPGSPLAKMGTTHFGRWVIIEQMHDEDGDATSDDLSTPYLLFTANLDGRRHRYLRDLVRRSPAEVRRIWSHCAGFPAGGDDGDVVRYLSQYRMPTSLFFVAYPRQKVGDVARVLHLRKTFVDFAIRAQGMEPAMLAATFRKEFG